MGAYWANEVGEVKAILVTQCSSYESQELGVSHRHRLANYVIKWQSD